VIEKHFRIVNKEQEDVDFLLNTAQRQVDDSFSNRMIIPKARREGISRYFLARAAVRCLGIRNTSAVVISHEAEATERMLLAVRYYLENFKGPKPLIRNMSKNEITFPKTNSMFYIGTAGSRAFGRGDTITDLHCSEVPHWPDAKKLMTGLLQAVPKGAHGRISIESTGNGMGDWFHNQCMRAAKGLSSFKLCFLPWHTFPEYTVDLSDEEAAAISSSLREDLEEPDLLEQFVLTPGQLAWRRIVIEDELDGDLYKWKQEYPSVLADCFQSSGAGFFQKVNYRPTPDWVRHDQHMHILRGHPRPDYKYVLGGDVSAGVGRDSSTMEVFCANTNEQVAEWLSNRTEPDIFSEHIARVGRLFGEANVCVESNNHGILTLAYLRGIGGLPPLYPMHKVYRTPHSTSRGAKDQVRRVIDLGQRTSRTSKPYILGLLRKSLRTEWTIHSPVLNAELSTFIENEDGTLGAASGCTDDTVIGAAMARFIFDKAALSLADDQQLPQTAASEQFGNVTSILAALESRHGGATHGLPFPDYITGDVSTPMSWEGIAGARLPS
jgi:hypothetical protein